MLNSSHGSLIVLRLVQARRLGVEALSLDFPLGPSKAYGNKVMLAYFAERLQDAGYQTMS